MNIPKPTFGAKECLARYIHEVDRQPKGRAKPTAFMKDEGGDQDGLSVNSLEVETERQIARIYSVKFNDRMQVALLVHCIEDYNKAADEILVEIKFDDRDRCWKYEAPEGLTEAFRHDAKDKNDSHCLVRFTRALSKNQEFKFARRMASKPTYTVIAI